MLRSSSSWLLIISLCQIVHGYAEFGTVTAPCNFEPVFTVPRPKFAPEDAYIPYAPYSSFITAVAPSLRFGRNGTHETSWSVHFLQPPTRTTRTIDRGLRRRGVFSGDPPTATCRQCDQNGNPINSGSNSTTATNGVPSCSVTNYDGVFRDGAFPTSSPPDYCFDAGYTGPLVPTAVPTDVGLPCCPVCYPLSTNGTNTSFAATTGVFSPTATLPGTSNSTRTTSALPGNTGGKTTVTITATQPTTITQTTLSIETITPTTTSGDPIVTTVLGTITGCGTASGCGTVIGSGTVYLAPFGFPGVVSSGTVSGCAPTIVGCGTMIVTNGIYTQTGPAATITACGEGTGSATLIGTGTVWPAGFDDKISFVSSGTLIGSGRVKGCGTITGYGTFTIDEPYTTINTPSAQPTTINVYVSYCPPDLGGANQLLRLSGNFTDDPDTTSPAIGLVDPDDPSYNVSSPYYNDRYSLSSVPFGNSTNDTLTNSTSDNPLCHVCPQDSGICCPPFSDCGADGHCPWTALEGCGYARFGVNIVASDNSSTSLGMVGIAEGDVSGLQMEDLKAPGLPGSGGATDVQTGNDESGNGALSHIRRMIPGGHVHVHGHSHGAGHLFNRRMVDAGSHVHGHTQAHDHAHYDA